ncbi:hypothetical protein BST61_g6499 [Cercospora zeina]
MHLMPLLTETLSLFLPALAYPTISSFKMPDTPLSLEPLAYSLTTIILPDPNINITQIKAYDPEPRYVWVEFYDNTSCIYGKGRGGRIISIQAWASGHWAVFDEFEDDGRPVYDVWGVEEFECDGEVSGGVRKDKS